MKGLTAKQRDILDFVEEFTETVGMAPTVYEIAEHFKIKTSTVFAHLRALQKKEFLTRSNKARSLALKHPKHRSRRPAGMRSVPLEKPVPVFQDGIRREIFCDAMLTGDPSDRDIRKLFAVKVKGEDMKDHGIFDGDIAILRRDPDRIRKGDIVLAVLNGVSVFRRCSRTDGKEVVFSADAPDKENIVLPAENLPLKGVVVSVQRSLLS